MIQLPKSAYWDKLVDYYYDNIHWSESEPRGLYHWLRDDYNADSGLLSNYIHFDNPADAMLFKLRWS